MEICSAWLNGTTLSSEQQILGFIFTGRGGSSPLMQTVPAARRHGERDHLPLRDSICACACVCEQQIQYIPEPAFWNIYFVFGFRFAKGIHLRGPVRHVDTVVELRVIFRSTWLSFSSSSFFFCFFCFVWMCEHAGFHFRTKTFIAQCLSVFL